MKPFWQCLLPTLLMNYATGQDTIRLVNNSFELTGHPTATLAGWKTLGVEPDVQPGTSGCVLPARDGANYVGLNVVGELSKGVSQELGAPLKKDSIYALSIYVAYSDAYQALQQTKRGFKVVNCDKPASLGVVGLNRQKGLAELMALTEPTNNKKWKKHLVYFRPTKSIYDEIGLVALPASAQRDWYGNLLIDRVSAIVQIPAAAADTLRSISSIPIDFVQTDSNNITIQNPSFDINYYGLSMAWGIHIFDNKQTKAPVRLPSGGMSLPLNYGVNNLYIKPSHGQDFASLIASKDGIWSGFSQTLTGASLKKGASYEFSLDLAFTKNYWEKLPGGYRGARYKNPLRLKIWAGTTADMRQELLGQTNAVVHDKWQRYTFRLAPLKDSYDTILLEATYVSDIGKPYNGNLLLDNCSAIVKISK